MDRIEKNPVHPVYPCQNPMPKILLYSRPLKAQRANLSKEARNMTVPEFDITPASVTSALHAA
jgi:hypothetical protein